MFIKISKKITFVYFAWVVTRKSGPRVLSGGILLKSCPQDLDCGAQGMNGKCNVDEDWDSSLD